MPVRDKRMSVDEVAGQLRDGMTIGIGGWGSRRKPMALVRAILRTSGTRPDGRLLRRSGRGATRVSGQGPRKLVLRLRLTGLHSV